MWNTLKAVGKRAFKSREFTYKFNQIAYTSNQITCLQKQAPFLRFANESWVDQLSDREKQGLIGWDRTIN